MIPAKLRAAIEGSILEPLTLDLATAVGIILRDNQMPFFPAYTDHGTEHVGSVLDAAIRLIPDEVFANDLVTPADAATLICGTLLHDLALHIRESGFVELVTPGARFKPLPWFDSPQAERAADAPWHGLWRSFQKEARHFTQSQLDRLLGPENRGVPEIATGDELAPSTWTQADRILIGEFLRRHHARLAHEIAIFGFPGTGPEFPCLRSVPDLAEASGLVARSHGEPMRLCLEYLGYLQPGNHRPFGVLLPYLIALLRIADYFQLESSRAPLLLLHLKDPQSPQSVQEWEKHRAVRAISWDTTDPFAVYIEVAPTQGLSTYLQLTELLHGLQSELDVTTAVLSETYRAAPLSGLRLAYQRVKSNIAEPSLGERLPFVPRRAVLGSAEDLFRLVIGDLYGNQPAVAGRELIQNAVDAVRERRWWEAHRNMSLSGAVFQAQDADVEVALIEDSGEVLLRVADRGIGMTPDVIIEYFLKAGAALGLPTGEPELNHHTAAAWLKTGRFGVGAFAAFLFGSEIRVRTRHPTEERGVTFTAKIDDALVQLDWAELPLGTEIVVPLDAARAHRELSGSELDRFFSQLQSFYRLPDPSTTFTRSRGGEEETFGGLADVPTSYDPDTTGWIAIPVDGFESVMWRPKTPTSDFVHNGITIENLASPAGKKPLYQWTDSRVEYVLATPDVAVVDTRGHLGVSLSRYQLTDRTLPFEGQLLHSVGCDIAAMALLTGSTIHALSKGWGARALFTRQGCLPFWPRLLQRHVTGSLCVLWVDPTSGEREDTLFVDPSNGPSWGDFPVRAVLEPPRVRAGPTSLGPPGIGIRLADIDTGVRLLTRLLDCVPVASVYATRRSDPSKSLAYARGWDPWPPGRAYEHDDDLGEFVLLEEEDLSSDDEDDYIPAPVSECCWRSDESEGVSSQLIRIADDLVQKSGAEAVGVTVITARPRKPTACDSASDAWEAAVNGFLPRDTKQRAALRRSVYAKNDKLRPFIDRQRP